MLYREPEAPKCMVKNISVFTVQTAQVYIHDGFFLFNNFLITLSIIK